MGHEALAVIEVDETYVRLPILGASKAILSQSFTMKITGFSFAKQEKVNEKEPILRGVSGSGSKCRDM
jgi:hypothetical protein